MKTHLVKTGWFRGHHLIDWRMLRVVKEVSWMRDIIYCLIDTLILRIRHNDQESNVQTALRKRCFDWRHGEVTLNS